MNDQTKSSRGHNHKLFSKKKSVMACNTSFSGERVKTSGISYLKMLIFSMFQRSLYMPNTFRFHEMVLNCSWLLNYIMPIYVFMRVLNVLCFTVRDYDVSDIVCLSDYCGIYRLSYKQFTSRLYFVFILCCMFAFNFMFVL